MFLSSHCFVALISATSDFLQLLSLKTHIPVLLSTLLSWRMFSTTSKLQATLIFSIENTFEYFLQIKWRINYICSDWKARYKKNTKFLLGTETKIEATTEIGRYFIGFLSRWNNLELFSKVNLVVCTYTYKRKNPDIYQPNIIIYRLRYPGLSKL